MHARVTTVEGVDRIKRKIERNTMLAAVHEEVSALLREAPKVDMKRSKLPGDPDALRGVPIHARHVGGTMRHTQPEAETIRRLSRNGR